MRKIVSLALLLAAVLSYADVLLSNAGTPGAPALSVWTGTDLGADSGTFFTETDSNTLSISAKGVDDETEGYFVSQPVSGDIQVVAEFTGFTGTLENFTFAGVRLADDLTATPDMAHLLWANIGQNRGKSRNAGVLSGGQFFGSASETVPTCVALTYRSSPRLVNMFESTDATCSGSWTLIAKDIPVTLDANNYAGIFCTSHNDLQLVNCAFDNVSVSDTITITPPASSVRTGVVYFANWETGAIQAAGTSPDGAFVSGMEPPLNGTCGAIKDGDGGAGDVAGNDYTRVVDSSVVTPVEGSYSMRALIHKNCDYNQINGGGTLGDIGGPKDKPRTAISLKSIGDLLPFDEYVWIGCAMYVPATWEDDTNTTFGQVNFFELQMVAGDTAVTHRIEPGFLLTVATQFDATQVDLPNPEGANVVLSTSLTPYLGRWVEFIWRVRMNPFTGAAGPHDTSGIAGSTGQSYAGDRGSLELWIDGVKKLNSQAPLGAVPSPQGWAPQAIQIYKPSWKQKSSSVVGPVVMYADGPWIGLESLGAGYQDVSPTQTACTDQCPP